jgi:aspartyl protease
VVLVTYPYEFTYPYIGTEHFPVLQFRVGSLQPGGEQVDVDAYLDTGAEQSLFEGWIARSVGLELLAGRPRRYRSTAGHAVEARLHYVRLWHPELGDFELEVGFSLSEITRNLLGRDFFDLVQIGFREHQLKFFVNPTP